MDTFPLRNPIPNRSGNVVVGRIIDIDRRGRTLTTISDGNLSTVIRFNVPENAKILDLFNRPTTLSGLIPGLRVRIRHTPFMTASIPPQTTALVIQVIR